MNCTCEKPGFCPVFSRVMSGRPYQICRGEVLSPEKCEAYRQNWLMMARPGPGTELFKIIKSLAISRVEGCGCDKMAWQMNTWGERCEEHREEILDHLRKAYAELNPTWADKARIAAKLLAMGVVVNPLDPAATLLNLALDLSRRNG